MTTGDILLDDDGDDSLALGDVAAATTVILLVAEKPEFLEMAMKAAASNPTLSFEQSPHAGLMEALKLHSPSAVVLELRMIEAFEDLGLIREIRRERPLIPIVAASENMDPDFMTEGFKAGATDYIGPTTPPDVLGFKLLALNKLSESARLIEVQNNQLVSTMQAQREADEKRMLAEKEKSVAEAQAEANRQTKEILDNLKEGFFVVERGLVIGSTTSKSCEAIFDAPIASKPFDEALPLVGDSPRYIKASLEQLFDNFMPLDVNLSLLPPRWITKSGKVVEVAYTPIMGANGDPERVIIAASDVTQAIEEKRRLEKANATNRALIQIINDRASFLEFMGDFKRDITTLETTNDTAVGKRILHTLKGNSAAYDLVELAEFIHGIEDEIAKIEDEAPALAKMQGVAKPILHELTNFLNKYSEILQLQSEGDSDEAFTINGAQIESLEKLATTLGEAESAAIVSLCNQLRRVPVVRLTKAFRQTVERISTRQRKSIAYRAEGVDLQVDSRRFGTLFRNLIHAVRNSCDHGIEAPDERGDKGKQTPAVVSLKVQDLGDNLQISILDDGRGLNKDKIVAKAIEKGLITQDAASTISKEEWVKLIFQPGFSTAENVTNVSGRGIGMDCIKTEVSRLGGNLDVRTRSGVGTQIVLTVPLKAEEGSDSQELRLAS